MNYRFMLCHSTLHSCLSKDTYFNVLSWVIFSPFISEKLCTSRCVHKAILLSLTRLYFVDHAVLRASTYYYWVLLLFFVDRSWAFHGPPKYVWIPLSSIWSFTEAIFSKSRHSSYSVSVIWIISLSSPLYYACQKSWQQNLPSLLLCP